MKLLVGIAAALVIAGSFYADWKWRRWMAGRKRERGQ
jgi:hypothetical protein